MGRRTRSPHSRVTGQMGPARIVLLGETGGEARQPFPQAGAKVVAVNGQLDTGLQVAQFVTGVVAASPEDNTVDTLPVALSGREFLQGIGELDFAAAARTGTFQHIKNGRVEHVAANDGQVGRSLTGGRLFNQPVDADIALAVDLLDVRAAVGADL